MLGPERRARACSPAMTGAAGWIDQRDEIDSHQAVLLGEEAACAADEQSAGAARGRRIVEVGARDEPPVTSVAAGVEGWLNVGGIRVDGRGEDARLDRGALHRRRHRVRERPVRLHGPAGDVGRPGGRSLTGRAIRARRRRADRASRRGERHGGAPDGVRILVTHDHDRTR